jgi:hypothetical protein
MTLMIGLEHTLLMSTLAAARPNGLHTISYVRCVADLAVTQRLEILFVCFWNSIEVEKINFTLL